MKYANIKYYDISNGLGVRTSLFVSAAPTDAGDASTKWHGILIMGKNLRTLL